MSRTLIVYFGRFPGGAAGAKRMRQVALGLRETGDQACILGYENGAGNPDGSLEWRLDASGIEYTCTSLAEGGQRKLGAVIDFMRLSKRMGCLALKAVQEQGFTRVLLYGAGWIGLRKVVNYLHRAGVPMIADMNEWFLFERGVELPVLDNKMFRHFCLPKVDGILGITPFWGDYANQIGKPAILIPAMGDNEFDTLEPQPDPVFTLVYVGVLFRRDLPNTMLDGVRLAAERGCRFRFIVLGQSASFPESVEARQRIAQDPLLRERTELTGWVSRERLVEIYRTAGAFLLLRQDDWVTRASFPTRLPEFLMTGHPVITSETREIAGQLHHAEDAWLLPPGHEPERLADAICHLAAHHEEALAIGRKGRESARSLYDVRLHGRRLREFLDTIEARRG